MSASSDLRRVVDVAIVGGGVAGLYAAWRLCAVRPDLSLALFEAAGQVGGRLRSFSFDALPDLAVDLGGMTFSRAHLRVAATVERLGLSVERLEGGRDRGLLFLRGRALRRRDVRKRGFRRLFPYALTRREQAKGHAKMLREAAERLVPGAGRMTRADWQALYESGHRLATLPFRTALAETIGFEALAYLQGRAGVAEHVTGPSALHALELQVETQRAAGEMMVPVGGFQRLPLALAEAVGGMGGAVHTGHRLVALMPAGEDGLRRLRLRDAHDGSETEIAARRVVLALPRRAIERIEVFPERDAPGSSLRALLGTVEPHPFGKMLLRYREAWWRPLGVDAGFSATDLPLGQIWFFPRADRPPVDGGMALAVFDDAALDFWRAMLPVPPEGGLQALSAGAAATREAHRQMAIMFGPLVGSALPAPDAALFQDWGADPFRGATHKWGAGVDAGRSAAAMLKPFPGAEIYVCGEAWSHLQGWVEGALERADAMLETGFGISPGGIDSVVGTDATLSASGGAA